MAKTKVLTEDQLNERAIKVKTILAATSTLIMLSAMIITVPSLWEHAQEVAAASEPAPAESSGIPVGSGVIIGILIAGYIWVVSSVARSR